MKKLAVVSLLVAAVFLFTACVQDPFEEYENFVNDLDVSARIEDAINGVGQGNTSAFFVDEIKTLYEDLGTFDQNNDSALEINQFYSTSVKDLLSAIDERKVGNYDLAESWLNDAVERYQSAQELYRQFLIKFNHQNNNR